MTVQEDAMQEENHSAAEPERRRLPGRLGPAIMLGGAALTVLIVFLPWVWLEVTDPSVTVRDGWYAGWELMLPAILMVLMIIPVVLSLIMLAGKGTWKRSLEVGFCSFAFGMEFLLLLALLGLGFVIQDISLRIDLFKVSLGPGYWAALFLLVVNVVAVVLTGYGARTPAHARAEGSL